MIDWIVRNFMYKPYDIVDDYVRGLSSEMVEFYGIVFITFVILWLLSQTTNFFQKLGIDLEKEEL